MSKEDGRQAEKENVLSLQQLSEVHGGRKGFGMDAAPMAAWSTMSGQCGTVGSDEWSTLSGSCRTAVQMK
jgi:hypothetical protein